jgi:hypothetical protein
MSDNVTVRDPVWPTHTPRGQLARQNVEAYSELTAHAEELSPEAAQAVGGLRETLTSLVARRAQRICRSRTRNGPWRSPGPSFTAAPLRVRSARLITKP